MMEYKIEAEKTFVEARAKVRISCEHSPPVMLSSGILG